MWGLLSSLFLGSGTTAIGAIGRVFDQLFTSDEERLDKKTLMLKLAQEPQIAQIELNKVEASHRSLFVAGWRPFIGWICGIALGYNFIVRDLLTWYFMNFATIEHFVLPPAIQMEQLMMVLLSLLGLGGYRTVEKLSGRTK